VIRVRDTGIGISAENLPHVFRRFWQADSSAHRRFQGVGIGLALVRELTEIQGGHVSVASQEGKGTPSPSVFRFFGRIRRLRCLSPWPRRSFNRHPPGTSGGHRGVADEFVSAGNTVLRHEPCLGHAASGGNGRHKPPAEVAGRG